MTQWAEITALICLTILLISVLLEGDDQPMAFTADELEVL